MPSLDVIEKPASYFYDERSYMWIKLVMENSPAKVLFCAARSYGAPMTTGILRFRLPKEIMNQPVIHLKRGNIESTYYFVQLFFAGLSNKVIWLE